MNKPIGFIQVLVIMIVVIGIVSTSCTIVYAETNTTQTSPTSVEISNAPEWIINSSNSYIINLLGQTYFDNYFSYLLGVDNGIIGKDGSRYNTMYNYTISNYSFVVNVRLDESGTVVVYNGPKRPYMFNITEDNALQTARQNGMLESIHAGVAYSKSGFISDSGLVTENYLWSVFSTNFSNNSMEAIYIDVDSGAVLGIKTFVSTNDILTANDYNATSVPENYSNDNETGVATNNSQVETLPQATALSSTYLIIIIAIILLVSVGTICYIKNK